MAYIRKHVRDGWRAQVSKYGSRESKVFPTREEAEAWGVAREQELSMASLHWARDDVYVSIGPQLVTLVPKTILEAAAQIPYAVTDILAAAVPTKGGVGIYFLISGREVIYVGQSVDVLHRIARHRREGRKFDAYAYIECESADLDRLESQYIRALVPRLNMSFGNVVERAMEKATEI